VSAVASMPVSRPGPACWRVYCSSSSPRSRLRAPSTAMAARFSSWRASIAWSALWKPQRRSPSVSGVALGGTPEYTVSTVLPGHAASQLPQLSTASSKWGEITTTLPDMSIAHLVLLRLGGSGARGAICRPPAKIIDRARQPRRQRCGGVPVQPLARQGDIGATLHGVVLRQFMELQGRTAFRQLQHQPRHVQHSDFSRVAQIDRLAEFRRALHQAHQAFDQVVYITERARLDAIAVDAERPARQRLHDEIRYHAAVVGSHARPIGIEDARDLHGDATAAVLGEQGFRASLAFVIARARAHRIDVAPVRLALRTLERVPVDFAGRRLQDARAGAGRHLEQLRGALHAG